MLLLFCFVLGQHWYVNRSNVRINGSGISVPRSSQLFVFLSFVRLIQCTSPIPTITTIKSVHYTVHGSMQETPQRRVSFSVGIRLLSTTYTCNSQAICRFRFVVVAVVVVAVVVVAAALLSLWSFSAFWFNFVVSKACDCVRVQLIRFPDV